MVIKGDSHNFTCFVQVFRLGDVFVRGCWVAAWMIVGHNDGNRTKSNGLTKDLARVEKCFIHGSTRNTDRFAKEMALCIEIQGKSAFLRLINADGQNLPHHIIR